MKLSNESLANFPDGEPIACSTKPVLTKAHSGRLRRLWSYGRPVHVPDLGGIDLDLVVHGFVSTVDDKRSACAVVVVTKMGIAHLNEVRQAQIAAQRPHHALGERLASFLRGKGMYTWLNVEFSNPDWRQPRLWGVVRPDVFACLPTLKVRSAEPAIYEVKVNRADFLADLAKPSKREAYAAIAEAVYYCCPDGLIDRTEVPDGFGLVCEVEDGSFLLRKKARRTKGFVLAADTAMTLMVKRQASFEDLV